MNPFVFVFGCPRSGTTVVQRVLDANPALCMLPGEQKWITRYMEHTAEERINDETSWEGLSDLMEEGLPPWMKRNEPQIRQLLAGGVSFRDFVVRVFELYGEMRGKEKAGNKNTKIAFHIRRMSDFWPWARFVHIIRDGRDVCLSVNSWRRLPQIKEQFAGGEKNPVMFAALWWRWRVLRGREAGSILGPKRYYEIRYEALTQNPHEESAKLCHFLSLPYDDSMVRFHEGRTKEQGRDAKHKWLPITPGLRDWRSQMAEEDVANFEIAGGDLLQTLGYPRMCQSFSAEKMEEADAIRELFPKQ